jgi:epoxyqueuosine reductase
VTGAGRASVDAAIFTERLVAVAYGLGFDAAGVAALGPPATAPAFASWLAAGRHGAMDYLAGTGAALREDARRPHAGATHAIVVAASYGGREPAGPVARYARGDDYHELLRERVRELHHWLEREVGHAVNARPYVDSGPVLERDLAQRAGLGWFGKNTMLITPRAGSHLFLASLFVELDLAPSDPFDADRCGSCTRCLDACPTGALPAPRVLDATRCISYLTIEHRDSIPEALRAAIGDLLYGCDICNDVCPYNRKFSKELAEDSVFRPRAFLDGVPSRELALRVLGMGVPEYTELFRGSAMKRAKLSGLRRNAAVVLGNTGSAADLPALIMALGDEFPLVRGHAAWAVGRIGSDAGVAALRERLAVEADESVRAEIESALRAADDAPDEISKSRGT